MDAVVDAEAAPTSGSDQFIITRRVLDMYLEGGPEQRSEKWFEMRGNRITGSVVDLVIKGRTAYSTKDRLLLEKAGMEVEFKGNIATRHGTKYEADAIALFEKRTGFRVLEFGLCEHPECALLAHSPDGIVLRPGQPPALLEVKTPFRRAFEDDTHIHESYTHQCLMGCSVFGVDSCYFVQYRPPGHMGKPELLTIIHEPHEPDWLATHLPTFEAFWRDVEHWRAQGWENHPLAAKLKPKPPRAAMFAAMSDDDAAVDTAPPRRVSTTTSRPSLFAMDEGDDF